MQGVSQGTDERPAEFLNSPAQRESYGNANTNTCELRTGGKVISGTSPGQVVVDGLP